MKRSFLLSLCAAATLALLIVAFPSWYFWGQVSVASLVVFSMFQALFTLERGLNRIPQKPWGRAVGALLAICAAGFTILLSRLSPLQADLVVGVAVASVCSVGVASWLWRLAKWVKSSRARKYPGADPFVHN